LIAKTVAITGASGFIGAHLVQKYLENGAKVIAIDNLVRGDVRRLPLKHKNLSFVNLDIRQENDELIPAISGADIVFHLAAVNGTDNFYKHPDLVLDVGIRGIINVMNSCRSANVRSLIVASSAEVYQSPPVIPTPETVPLMLPDSVNPRYSYGGSKIITELVAMNYHQEFFDRVIIFRPHNVYGPNMGSKHVIPQLILKSLQISEDESLKVLGSLKSSRAFAYISDVIDGLFLLDQKGRHREIYHIGTDEEISIGDLAKKILSEMGINAMIETQNNFKGETLRRCPDISKIKKLGYQPKIEISTGLRHTVNWYKENYKINLENSLI
jgi:UDP-glucose 4-epimerase